MAFTQEQVNNWFTANPNATPELVAQTVQGLGGLEANQGLAGMIGQHYGTDANTITSNYNTLTAPAAPVLQAAPVTPVTPVAQPASPLQTSVDQWKAANSTATPQQMANAIAANGGLTPEMAQAVAQAYGTDVNTITSGYDRLNPYSQMASSYANKDYTGLNSLIGQSGLNTSQIQQHFGLTDEQLNQARGLGVNLNYTTPEIQNLVNSTLGSKKLTPFEQVNSILETGQKYGFGTPELEKLYGKDKVDAALNTYKGGINDFLTQTLAKDAGTTNNEVGLIHQAAQKYGLTPDEIAKYGGLDPKTVQAYFAQYDQGLGTIVSRLNDPKIDDITKTQTALALAKEWGTTDEELAKASKGKYTTADIKAYLDPVRSVPTNFQKLMNDPDASAADITKFVADAKKDPRTGAIYGAGLDKLTPDPAALAYRDIQNGTGSLAQNYQNFLTAAKSTPELAAKYADAINSVQKRLDTATFSANEVYGGKPQDYQLQIVSKLPAKAVQNIPQQLEMTPVKTETKYDPEYGNYEVKTGGGVKSKGVVPIGGEDTESGQNPITGYRATEPTTVNGATVYATYDAQGKLTGYEGDSRQRSWLNGKQSISGNWDANGNPKPQQYTSSGGGFLKGVAKDAMAGFSDLGIAGQLALMYLTAGAGSALGGAMGGGLLGNAAASGLIGGTMSELGGGEFGKGFLGGAVGSGVGQLAQGAIPTGGLTMTGVPMIDTYLTQALPKAAGSMAGAGVTGGDIGDAGIYSLLNSGVNMGTNSLLQNSGIGTLDPKIQPYATGVASNVISSALTGKDPNVQNALMKTLLQQATSKTPTKTANVP